VHGELARETAPVTVFYSSLGTLANGGGGQRRGFGLEGLQNPIPPFGRPIGLASAHARVHGTASLAEFLAALKRAVPPPQLEVGAKVAQH